MMNTLTVVIMGNRNNINGKVLATIMMMIFVGMELT